MAVGKNKGLIKGGKKGMKKKVIDPFSRKDWYDVKAPAMFSVQNIGKTLVNRTQGTIYTYGLKGHVFEVSLADLQNDEIAFRKFRLIAEEVQGKNVLTNFYGMNLTTDKVRSMVKKWQTLIEACVEMLKLLMVIYYECSALVSRRECPLKSKRHAMHNIHKHIRKRMTEILVKEVVSSSDLKEVVNKLIPDSIV
ncbi:UNVERIFIED_CONTAM: 40S ribosomal protein S3a [Trichonephila clavipes]